MLIFFFVFLCFVGIQPIATTGNSIYPYHKDGNMVIVAIRKEVVLEAVKQDGRALEYASEELRGDKEVVMEAVKQYGRALEYASEELRGDKEVVMEAVKQNGLALEYASDEFIGVWNKNKCIYSIS